MKAKNRGIVIVSILVLTLLATFFLGALVQMNPSRLRRNVHDENRDRASMAARAGVDYVLNRFKSDTNWIGDANTKTVEMKDLVVREDNGNVLGWIRAEDGSWAGFRVRFNAQDGDGGFDGRSDPSYPIQNSAVSLNNLDVPDSRPVPRATSGSVLTGSIEPNDANTVMVAPPNSVALQVEGIVSSDLRPDNPNGLAEAEEVTMRTVEGIFVISDIVSNKDDSDWGSFGGDGSVELKTGTLSLKSYSDSPAVIRSKGSFKISRNGGGSGAKFEPDEDAEVRTNPGFPFEEVLADGSTFRGGSEEKDATFLKIEWERVKDSEQSEALKLPGGVYIFTDGDADGGRNPEDNVKYFDMSWPQYKAALLDSDPNTPVESTMPAGFREMVELDKESVALSKNGDTPSNEKRDVITVSGDITIEDPDGKGLTIAPERGARQTAGEDGDLSASDEPAPITVSELNTIATSQPVEVTNAGTMVMNYIVENYSGTTTGPSGGIAWDWGNQANYPFTYEPTAGFVSYDPQVAATGSMMVLQQVLSNGTIQFPNGPLNPVPAGLTPMDPADYGPGISASAAVYTIDSGALLQGMSAVPDVIVMTGSNIPGDNDPLHIPKVNPETGLSISLDGGEADETVPQDIEIVFDPGEGNDSAFIRSETDIFLGTHLSGEGGGVVSNRKVNLVGFGINIDAQTSSDNDAQVSKMGVAIYGKDGINISTYDERRNHYWDTDIAGAVFTEGNIFIRLGEDDLPSGEDPGWGKLRHEGAIIALGDSAYSGGGDLEDLGGSDNGYLNYSGGDDDDDGSATPYDYNKETGKLDIVAEEVDGTYNSSYLAPYLEEETINPTFTALSVVER